MMRKILLSALAVAFAAAPAVAEIAPGQKAAAFSLPTPRGGQVALGSLQGKVVVIDIWASWCEPCQHELPLLDKLQKQYADKGVAVVAVNIDERKDNALAMLKKLAISALAVGLDTSGKVAGSYDPPKMPTTFVLDREGVVRYVNAGFDGDGDIARLRKQIDTLLASR